MERISISAEQTKKYHVPTAKLAYLVRTASQIMDKLIRPCPFLISYTDIEIVLELVTETIKKIRAQEEGK